MSNLKKHTQKQNINLNQPANLRNIHMCTYHCAQLSYTIQHRALFWLFSLLTSRQSSSIAQTLPYWRAGSDFSYTAHLSISMQTIPSLAESTGVHAIYFTVAQYLTRFYLTQCREVPRRQLSLLFSVPYYDFHTPALILATLANSTAVTTLQS